MCEGSERSQGTVLTDVLDEMNRRQRRRSTPSHVTLEASNPGEDAHLSARHVNKRLKDAERRLKS